MTDQEAGTRILLVEDDEDIRTAVEDFLVGEGFSIALAGDGREALAHLESSAHLPHLIILDLTMPVLDGRGFLTERLKEPRIADIPVILMSAAREKEINLGENLVLAKPIDIDDLLAAIFKVTRTKS